MKPVNTAGLAIVFRNPEPRREAQYPEGWMLLSSDRWLQIFVGRDDARRPALFGKKQPSRVEQEIRSAKVTL
jgi:hypothetical protein